MTALPLAWFPRLASCLDSCLCPQKCSEEKIEILQGKISLLEDQLAKLGDCSAQEKGEVMGDILKVWLCLE